jgi:hypothetical protein
VCWEEVGGWEDDRDGLPGGGGEGGDDGDVEGYSTVWIASDAMVEVWSEVTRLEYTTIEIYLLVECGEILPNFMLIWSRSFAPESPED